VVQIPANLTSAEKAGLIKRTFRLLRDPAVRTPNKLVLLFWLAYDLSPVDAIPDVVPVFGIIDDAGVTTWAMYLALWVSRRYREHEAAKPGPKPHDV